MSQIRSKPILILLPGMDGTGELFQWVIPFLEPSFEIKIFPLPDNIEQDYETLENWLASKIEWSNFILLGESFSGPLAIKLCKKFPKAINGLILISSFRNAPVNPLLINILSKIPIHFLPKLALRIALFSSMKRSNAVTVFEKIFARLNIETIRQRILSVALVHFENLSTLGEVPTLIINGSRDIIVRPKNFINFEKDQKSSRNIIIDAPHMLLQTKPREASEEILSFATIIISQKS